MLDLDARLLRDLGIRRSDVWAAATGLLPAPPTQRGPVDPVEPHESQIAARHRDRRRLDDY
jgi:hypothetical protein